MNTTDAAEAEERIRGSRVRLPWEATPLALFAGHNYYPRPGFLDLCGLFTSIEDAEREGKKITADKDGWWQVVDLFTLNIVADG